MLEINQMAPEFTSINQRHEAIRLSDYKGKKLLFYIFIQKMTRRAVRLKRINLLSWRVSLQKSIPLFWV